MGGTDRIGKGTTANRRGPCGAALTCIATRYFDRRVRMKTSRRIPSELLPLTPAMFYVLVALADRDQHGYAIIKAVARHTSDKVVLSTGTLYGIIKRLLAEGLIVESARRPAAALDDERRRYYRLTIRASWAIAKPAARGDGAVVRATLSSTSLALREPDDSRRNLCR